MSMNPAFFLTNLDRLITGHGFKTVFPISIYDFHLDDSFTEVGAPGGDEPGFVKVNDHLVVQWAATKTLPVNLQFQVPDDYDETEDHLKLRLKAYVVSALDTPTMTAAAYKDSDGTTDLAPTVDAALSTTSTWVEFDLSSNSLVAGDIVSIDITMGTHANDVANIIGTKVEYKSDLVFYDPDER